MRDDVRKFVEAALDKLTPAKAQELARSLAKGEGREQVSKLAHDLLEWSQRNRERVTELIRREVKDQLKTLGVATKDEMEALKKRVRALEKATKQPESARRQPAKRQSPKRPKTGA